MSALINGYKISSSNSSAKQPSTLFIKAGQAVMVRMQSDTCSNLLSHIRRAPKSLERLQFVQECLSSGIDAKDVQAILTGTK